MKKKLNVNYRSLIKAEEINRTSSNRILIQKNLVMFAILVLYTYVGIHILPGRRNVDFSRILTQRRKRNAWYIFLPFPSLQSNAQKPVWLVIC